MPTNDRTHTKRAGRRFGTAAIGLCVAAGLAVLVCPPRRAAAAFPGRNGVIVFDRDYLRAGLERAQIFSVRSDGSGLKKLSRGNVDVNPSFSPDGRRIVFVSFLPSVHTNVFVMSSDGTHRRRLTHDAAYESAPVFSPDGRRIVFVRRALRGSGGIFVMSSNGSGVQLLHRLPSVSRPGEASPTKELSFSPDGHTIAFTQSVGGGRTEIFEMSANGSNVRQLTRTLGGGSSREPDFSPDGSQIVFTRAHTQTQTVCPPPPHPQVCRTVTRQTTDLFLMNADGSNVRQLTSFASFDHPYSPGFSPDGQKIVFLQRSAQFTEIVPTEIYMMNLDGSHVTRLTGASNSHLDQYPSWQPLR